MSTLFDIYGYLDREDCLWRIGEAWEANALLSRHHYLGPLRSGARMTVICQRDGEAVGAMMWKHPTSRRIPSDGTWLELSRWCLTPAMGGNGGSRMHRWAVKLIREHLPAVTTLVSYSDPVHGHTGALYRACNWQWAPTWHRLRPPPTGQGDWGTGPQDIKDRWVFCVQSDDRRADVLAIEDRAAIRHWQANATEAERRWARRSLTLASVDVEVADRVPRQQDRGLDREAGPIDAAHDMVDAIHANAPSRPQSQEEPRVGLIPVQTHERSVVGGAA